MSSDVRAQHGLTLPNPSPVRMHLESVPNCIREDSDEGVVRAQIAERGPTLPNPSTGTGCMWNPCRIAFVRVLTKGFVRAQIAV